MSYEINDRTLIEEMCGDIRNTAQAEYEKLKERLKQEGRDLPGDFAFPLDEDIVGPEGDLKKLLSDQENAISYSKAGKLDNLWRSLLNKSIVCLRYFDTREPFLDNPNKAIEMGRNGHLAVEKKYNWNTQAEHLLNIYSCISVDIVKERMSS